MWPNSENPTVFSKKLQLQATSSNQALIRSVSSLARSSHGVLVSLHIVPSDLCICIRCFFLAFCRAIARFFQLCSLSGRQCLSASGILGGFMEKRTCQGVDGLDLGGGGGEW